MSRVKNKDLHEPAVIEMILSYLHEMQVPIEKETIPIQTQEHLDHIKQSDYVVLPIFEGTPIWLCIFMKSDVYYAVTFPKYLKRNVYNAKVYPVNMIFGAGFYNGTILEGTLFKDRNKIKVVINDVHYSRGIRLTTMSREDRLNRFRDHLQRFSTVVDENYAINTSLCYQLTEFSLKNLFERLRDNFNIRKLLFCPNNAGTRVFEYTLHDEDRLDRVIKKGIFDMQKLGSDVYHLCYPDTNERIGIAYIPDIHVAKMCAAWFKDRKKVRASCILDPVFQKYVPSELIE